MHKQPKVSVHAHDHGDQRIGLITREWRLEFVGHDDMLRESAHVHKMAEWDG